jgi:hypothetical protein
MDLEISILPRQYWRNYMRVINKLQNDYRRYGSCQYIEVDTDYIYAIERIHPWMSQVEVSQIMDQIEREVF